MRKEAINKRIAALESELTALKAELSKLEKFEFNYEEDHTLILLAEVAKPPYLYQEALNNFRYR